MINKIVTNYIVYLLRLRMKPRVLQMPVTTRCNSRCKTCNVWKQHEKVDIDPEKLKIVLQDSFFFRVEAVGINGGEFTIMKNLNEILDSILSLKRLKYVHLISNGLLPQRLLDYLTNVKKICEAKNVRVGFTLSVDGVGDIHESVRGVRGSFSKVRFLLDEFTINRQKYCDEVFIGCTISKYNLSHIKETEAFFSNYDFFVEYHLAVPNKRIFTFEDSDYYVLADERSRLLATEFFYEKYRTVRKLSQKMKYFSVYYFLRNKGKGRISQCDYLYRDVTIDEHLNLSLCATASDAVGNLNDDSATSLFKKGKIDHLAKINIKYCDTCIHYAGIPTLKGIFVFLHETLWMKFTWSYMYKYLVKW